MVQWLRLHTPNSGGPDLIPDHGTRSCIPQLKILHSARPITGGEGDCGTNRERSIEIYIYIYTHTHTAMCKIIASGKLLYGTGSSTWCSVMT